MRSKATKCQLISPFLLILFLHSLAIFLFTRGFLLTRTELTHFSNCTDISSSSSSSSSPSPCSSNSTCWTQPSIDRLVIIVFDALRFDFVAPSSFFPEKKPWMDKLPVIQKLAADIGSSSRIFKAIADPPTTSLQRLKGLTTGGLPTFIDVGHSFGAPAIVEDNFIQQLVENGKRVVMMGDDTWLQLFPHHFHKSFPYPSFNVKDLDTVDNGCIEHLLPSLEEGNWDVLIAHFLGVDHAGHIFGVDTEPMAHKLKQYNHILEEVVESLKNHSGPGGLHENTFLVVMGDHGQTLNGDHGGGSPEEVETSIFAMSLKHVPSFLPPELDPVSCGLNMDAKQICIGTIEQLDFAATMSAMLGVPFPFGSIGRVNPQLHALGASNILPEDAGDGSHENYSNLMTWMRHYVNVLCINAWQVKRYIHVYSSSSVIGFPTEDLAQVENMYSQAQKNWFNVVKDSLSCADESCTTPHALKGQIDLYLQFLDHVIGLARSKWTEFNLLLMVVGLSTIMFSLILQFIAIGRVSKFCWPSVPFGYHKASLGLSFAVLVILVRGCSFLSNSYILEEGKVAIFFLGSSVILVLRYSIGKTTMLLEAISLLVLVFALRFLMEFGLSKQAANSLNLVSILGIAQDHPVWKSFSLTAPILALCLLAFLLHRFIYRNCRHSVQKLVILGSIFCYLFISVHWVLESNLIKLPILYHHIGRVYIPQLIYTLGIAQLVSLVIGHILCGKKFFEHPNDLAIRAVVLTSALSSTIILLSGTPGSFVALVTVGAAWCIVRLENLGQAAKDCISSFWTVYPFPLIQWSLLAVALFFSTGHWCAFDGLRYGAAFVGFDEFMLIRQAILLAIDTFGFSHLIPIFGLPILVFQRHLGSKMNQSKLSLSVQLSQVFLMYGLTTATATTFTMLCVTIQRRHLMVWGLFAPKYVFDVVSLIITDVTICLASLFFIDLEGDSKN